MGRKRNQGKARKAARAAKAKQEAEERGNNEIAKNELEQPLAAPSLLPRCRHGADNLTDEDIICLQLADPFATELYQCRRAANGDVLKCLQATHDATLDAFADVWCDAAKMENEISCFLCAGTQNILEGNYDSARDCATAARYLKQYIAVGLEKTLAVFDFPKIVETYYSDMHTLVKFFRKRIPCTCLNEKYEEVKDITKLGFCFNPQCTVSLTEVERSKTMCCSRCRNVTYCSRECQISHFTKHKRACDMHVTIQAKFDAKN